MNCNLRVFISLVVFCGLLGGAGELSAEESHEIGNKPTATTHPVIKTKPQIQFENAEAAFVSAKHIKLGDLRNSIGKDGRELDMSCVYEVMPSREFVEDPGRKAYLRPKTLDFVQGDHWSLFMPYSVRVPMMDWYSIGAVSPDDSGWGGFSSSSGEKHKVNGVLRGDPGKFIYRALIDDNHSVVYCWEQALFSPDFSVDL